MTRLAPRSARRARNLGSVLVAAALSMGLAAPALAQATPSVSASFNAGVLTVTGDGADNTISISRNGRGVIEVNGGTVAVGGGTPSIRNTTLIQIAGQGGADQIYLEQA